jgi:glycosyltransferase involved in cell wall biosynthesis
MTSILEHISVCICTYKRPKLLANLLTELQNQSTNGLFTYSILVVDNDDNESAKSLIEDCRIKSRVPIDYYKEPNQNIALARNKAVQNARGDFIAFIDDDEFPEPTWLLSLFNAYKRYSADGVLGPVIPFYEGTPPEWLVKSGLCARRSFQTGTVLNNSMYMRTGNVLFNRHILEGLGIPFDKRFGRTGGEDTDFFKRMLCNGRSFVWCNEAHVYETVPIERQKISYFLKRALVLGRTAALREKFISTGTLKSIVALIAYTVSLPVLLVIKYHLFIKYLYKVFNHLSKLLAHFKIKLVNERTF